MEKSYVQSLRSNLVLSLEKAWEFNQNFLRVLLLHIFDFGIQLKKFTFNWEEGFESLILAIYI